MDLLAVMLIGAVMFAAGSIWGYTVGVQHGRDREKLERRIDEITETVRL